jgi:glycosyltransferase involved in cell wall biosynthesis
MKVLVIVEQAEPSRYYRQLFQNLLSMDLEICLLNLRSCPEFKNEIKNHVYEYMELGLEKNYYKGIPAIIKKIKNFQPAVIHSHEIIPSFYAALSKLLFKKVKLIYHRHHNFTEGWKNKLMDTVAAIGAKKVVAVSNAMENNFQKEHPFLKSKATVIYNGIDIALERTNSFEEQATLKELQNLKNDVPYILLLARFRPVKGHEAALKAAQILINKKIKFKLIFAGEGTEKIKIVQLVEKWKLSNYIVILPGIDDVKALIELADFMIIPSLFEPFGLTSIEGASAGKPVIASRVGGLVEIIRDLETGLLIQPNAPEELANTIQFLLENPEEKSRMGRNAKERYRENFTPQIMSKQFYNLYQSTNAS